MEHLVRESIQATIRVVDDHHSAGAKHLSDQQESQEVVGNPPTRVPEDVGFPFRKGKEVRRVDPGIPARKDGNSGPAAHREVALREFAGVSFVGSDEGVDRVGRVR